MVTSVSGRVCDTFSAGKCIPEPDTIIGDPIKFDTETLCQEFCELNADCTYYQYRIDDCQMYKADYRQLCNIYGGSNVSRNVALFHFLKEIV